MTAKLLCSILNNNAATKRAIKKMHANLFKLVKVRLRMSEWKKHTTHTYPYDNVKWTHLCTPIEVSVWLMAVLVDSQWVCTLWARAFFFLSSTSFERLWSRQALHHTHLHTKTINWESHQFASCFCPCGCVFWLYALLRARIHMIISLNIVFVWPCASTALAFFQFSNH